MFVGRSTGKKQSIESRTDLGRFSKVVAEFKNNEFVSRNVGVSDVDVSKYRNYSSNFTLQVAESIALTETDMEDNGGSYQNVRLGEEGRLVDLFHMTDTYDADRMEEGSTFISSGSLIFLNVSYGNVVKLGGFDCEGAFLLKCDKPIKTSLDRVRLVHMDGSNYWRWVGVVVCDRGDWISPMKSHIFTNHVLPFNDLSCVLIEDMLKSQYYDAKNWHPGRDITEYALQTWWILLTKSIRLKNLLKNEYQRTTSYDPTKVYREIFKYPKGGHLIASIMDLPDYFFYVQIRFMVCDLIKCVPVFINMHGTYFFTRNAAHSIDEYQEALNFLESNDGKNYHEKCRELEPRGIGLGRSGQSYGTVLARCKVARWVIAQMYDQNALPAYPCLFMKEGPLEGTFARAPCVYPNEFLCSGVEQAIRYYVGGIAKEILL